MTDGTALLPASVAVTSRHRETHDTWTLRLDGGPQYAPGQFGMLYAFGAGEAPISVSAIDGGAQHTIRIVGSATRALCELETIGVRGPYGNAWPVDEADGSDVVLVAGGIGLAPLRPVIYALRDRARLFVLYGARTPADLLYTDELDEWGAQVIVDVPAEGWHGPVGVVTKLIAHAPFDERKTIAMVCGPEVMMRFAAAALRQRGVAPDAIWVSLERSMRCGAGHCGHCQLGPIMICRDGAVFRHDQVEPLMRMAEL